MNLVVHELGITGAFGNTTLKQAIRPTRDVFAYAVVLHLYKHLAPAGSLYVQIQDSNGRKIKNSDVPAISTISSANYFHGDVRFLIDFSFRNQVNYFIALKSTGYTYASNAFIGWCNGFDLKKYPCDYTVPSTIGVNAPLDFAIWEKDTISKGEY